MIVLIEKSKKIFFFLQFPNTFKVTEELNSSFNRQCLYRRLYVPALSIIFISCKCVQLTPSVPPPVPIFHSFLLCYHLSLSLSPPLFIPLFFQLSQRQTLYILLYIYFNGIMVKFSSQSASQFVSLYTSFREPKKKKKFLSDASFHTRECF